MDQHVLADLSAYLDGELPGDRASAVSAHLAACAACRTRSGELRAAASLIARVPPARAPRGLVPPLRTRWSLLYPLRSLSAVASGAFVLLFIASATLSTGYRFGMEHAARGAPTAGAPAGAPVPAADATATEDPQKRATTTLDAQRSTQSGASPAPGRAEVRTAPPTGGAAAMRDERGQRDAQGLATPPQLGSPWLWLALAVLSAGATIYAHRRLRRA